MPGQLKDQLPNRALSGPELAEITRKEFTAMLNRDVAFGSNVGYKIAAFSIEVHYDLGGQHPPHDLKSRTPACSQTNLTGTALRDLALIELSHMLHRDYAFQGSVAYRRSEFTITATFHLGNPYDPKPEEIVPCEIAGEAPLRAIPKKSAVVALERKVTLENPNIDRINHDMPIVVQRATPPMAMIPEGALPGEPPASMVHPPQVDNLEFRYDPTTFPSPAPPVDTDISQKAAARLGVPLQTGAGS